MFSRRARVVAVIISPRLDYLWLGAVLFAIGAHVMWRGGAFVAAGDYFPCTFVAPWRCFADAAALWGTTTSPFGAVQFAPGIVALSWIARALDLIGVHGALAQTAFHGGLIAFEGIGAAVFARALWRSRAAGIAAGAGIAVSLYTAQFVLAAPQSFAVGLFGLSAGLALERARAPVPAWRYGAELGALSLGAMLLMLTPPLGPAWVLWTAAWVVGSAVIYRSGTAFAGAIMGALVAVALNAWWIYAGILSLSGGGGSTQTSFAGAGDIRFVDRNASIMSLLTMRGGWAWGQPDYTAWSVAYDVFPLSIAPFALPVLALVGLFAAKRRIGIALASIVVVCLFIAKGTHAPFGAVNSFLYSHAPLAWLLRDPQYETDPPLYLCLFALAGLGCARIGAWAARIARRFDLSPASIGNAVYAVATLALCTSGAVLIDGSALPATWLRGSFSTAITIPSYWRDAGAWLARHGDGSRILLLPADDFYAMPYSFGYYGADDVAEAYLPSSPVRLSSQPLNYLSANADVLGALSRLDRALRTHRRALTMLRALGIGWIVERRDILSTMPNRRIESPEGVSADLAAQSGVALDRRIGLLDVYRVSNPAPRVSGYADEAATEATVVLFSGGDSHYDAQRAPNTRLIRLGDAYADGWQAFSGRSTGPLPHVRVDGVLNGWLVPPAASDIRIEFVPERAHRILQSIAVMAMLLVVLALGAAAALPARWTSAAHAEPRRP